MSEKETQRCADCNDEIPEDNISDLCGPCAYEFMVNYMETHERDIHES